MKYFTIAILLLASLNSNSQTKEIDIKKANLREEILKMDSLLFNAAFNHCDTTLFKKILSDNIEFYDDRTGLNTSKELEVKSLVEKCARKDSMIRVLKSTTVTKLGDFGAVQLGEHDFVINGITIGSGQFIHIWERTRLGWKLKRIVSYEHATTGK
jgi:hypothetical protein